MKLHKFFYIQLLLGSIIFSNKVMGMESLNEGKIKGINDIISGLEDNKY
jgi:hypothetical protein